MTSSAQFNVVPLLSVKPALDDSLGKISESLDRFFASNGADQESLQNAIEELHRSFGVLRMLSLDGVLVFCSELEKLLREFAAGSLPYAPMHQEIIQRALLILTHYLAALADGAPNAALRLFNPYQELLQARGIETAFEVDLFFPDLNIELPPAVRNVPQAPDASARVKAARSQYQQSLLKWLRQDNTAEALQAMRSAVLGAMSCLPPDKQRTFWWVAAGLLDCLIYDGIPPELSAKKLLGRVDLHMKSLAEGKQVDERATLNEMLYMVAHSHAVSDTVEEIKRRYALDVYLPEEPPLPPGETAQVLEQMRSQLNEAQEIWEKCTQDAAACKDFAAKTEQLYELSERLDRNTLQLLCKQIHTAALPSGNAEYIQHTMMDMAMALMLLESGIVRYTHLGGNFHEQARILGQRMQVAESGMQEEQELGHLVQLHCQMVERDALAPLAKEMLSNLQHVEQELNVFFENQDKRDELPRLVRMLNQVQGCLYILSLETADQLLKKLRLVVSRYSDGGKASADEMRDLATTMSALEAYVQEMTYGQKPDATPLEEVIRGLEAEPVQAVTTAPVTSVPDESAAEPVMMAVQPAAEDNEMLEVFLEEAQEVLQILRTNLELSQLHPDSMEPLVTMRRGFHTLKGSGRMVGLNDLGEVAWAAEKAMNKWLQENKPASRGLLQFIADAEALFHTWVNALQSRKVTAIDAAPLVAAAQQIENGQEPSGVPQATGQVEPLPNVAAGFETPAFEMEMPVAPELESAEKSQPPSEIEFVMPDLSEVLSQAAPGLAAGAELQQPSTVEFTMPDLSEMVPAVPETAAEAPPSAVEFTMPDLSEMAPPAVSEAAAEAEPQQPSMVEFTMPDLSETVPSVPEAAAEVSPSAVEFSMPDLSEMASPPAAPEAAAEAEPQQPSTVEFTMPDLSETVPSVPEAAAEVSPSAVEFSMPDLSEMAPPPAAPEAAAEVQPSAEFTMSDLTEIAQQSAPEVIAEPLSLDALLMPEIERAAPAPQEKIEAAPILMQEQTTGTSVEPESEADTVVVGNITLSASLFNIASEECASNLAALQQGLAALRASAPPEVAYDFMRAAHTLAGVNRTMGFSAVADLSRAVELWLEARIGKPFELNAEQLDLVEQAITMLDAMFLDICNHQEPQPQPELIARLQASQELLYPAEAVVVTGAVETASPVAGAEFKDVLATKSALAPIDEFMAKVETFELLAPAVRTEPSPIAAPETQPAIQAVETAKPFQEVTAPIRQRVEERVVQDDIDEQLLPIFLEESNDLQPQIGNTLRAWRDNPDDLSHGRELQRGLHTLKGSARMAGVMRLGELTHRMEDRVVAAMTKVLRNDALWEELDSYFDRISNALERLRSGATLEEPAAAPAESVAAPAEQAVVTAVEKPGVRAEPKPEAAAERAATMLRVRSDTVDRLVNEAGEISVARSRVETELRAFKTGLVDISDSVIRLRKQLREIEIQAESQMEARVALSQDMAEKFDPLEFDRFTRFQELTRFMTESVHDMQTVQQTLMKNLDETAAALSAQAYLNRELQQSLMAIRMVPFAGISDRLHRIVRQTAKELNKRANLDLRGVEVELDRSVLDKMTAPFEHLLRNAVAHGLESPEERNRKGKPVIGDIHLALTQESNEVVFELSDDGAGLNLDRLRQKAVEQGLAQPGETITDEDAMQLIFSAGLSTATEVTEISGRGVGMDVVRNEITALGGRIDVHSERGKGTRFTIRLPLTLAVTQVLMLRAGQDNFAVPSVMVEQVLHIKSGALEEAYLAGQVDWQGKHYPLRYLPHLLGNEGLAPEKRLHNPVLLLRSGELRMALHVDELHGNQETVVKNIGPQLARLPGIAGATVQGNGRVVLILNPIALLQRVMEARKETIKVADRVVAPAAAVEVAEVVEAPSLHAVPVVMVVDDSLTVRKVTSRMLTRAGYEVVTAKDGVDALEQLTQVTPSVMLLDVEMPRMDGFELTKQIRQDPKLNKLPILMITSRTADKHRDYALELGVNAYFGKPFQEEELLQQIAAFVGKPQA